ncbi:MAG: ABC transporter ATP-binding protein [Thermoplasmata archaeon]|jgi:Fe-S cluster assembly ATP-binding protein|nr:ABC transporter ATP-binding protein [Thermoplasmata archaeon]MBR6214055.1 ABC transporter ATP-binding protein [Candidatus Methanomethylophilaceae archaeon]
MLNIVDLHVEAGGREILKGVNLTVKEGETSILFGPNGSGKSTLLASIMGYSTIKVTQGEILFKGKNITDMPVDERAKMGIGMMMQRPPNIYGVKLGDLLRATANDADKAIAEADRFRMEKFMDREINVGFSGGEIKRSELLQLTAQSPELLLLDEPESGVDLESIDLIGRKVHDILEEGRDSTGRHVSSLVITHTGQIMDYIGAKYGYVMKNGVVDRVGDPMELLKEIREHGYGE